MAKVKIDTDEWYPVYFLNEQYGEEVEVSDLTLERWRMTFRAFTNVQQEMRAAAAGEGGLV